MNILFIALFVLNIASITLSIMNLRRIKKDKAESEVGDEVN